MRFHLLDVLSHDFQDESENEETHAKVPVVPLEEGEESEEGEFDEEADQRPRKSQNQKPRKFQIELFGSNEEGKPVHLTVTDFKPYFYCSLNTQTDELMIKADLNRKLGSPFEAKVVSRKLLFGYTGGRKFSFLKMTFPSLAIFRKAKNLFLDKKQKPIYKIGGKGPPLRVYEANLDPMLRFFHQQNISPCGWVEADCDFEVNESNGRLESVCDWTSVTLPEADKMPGVPAPCLMASWDIECFSESGDFPVPENRSDAIIQIGTVLVRGSAIQERHIFVLGTCDPIEGVILHKNKDEKSLLLDWCSWISLTDPDILYGYNVFGFDERYLWARMKLLGITMNQAVQSFSRHEKTEVSLKESSLSSSALGDNKLYTWTTPGRLQIDLFHYIKRLEALPNYKLDAVAAHYMSGKLKGINVSEIPNHLKLKTAVTRDIEVGRNIQILDETGEPIFESCKVKNIDANELLVEVLDEDADFSDLDQAVKWAIVKDDVSPADIFRLHKGTSADRAKVAAYCIQDCVLVYELFQKLDVFNNAMSMANVCSVPIHYIFTRGQGIKIESLIFKECAQRDQLIEVLESTPFGSSSSSPDDMSEGGEAVNESYEGAIVFDPVPDFYFDSPVGVCDFASLYPSSIISENISYDSLLWAKDYDLNGKLIGVSYGGDATYVEPGVQWTDIEFDILGKDPEDTRKNPNKIKTGLRICRYAQPPGDAKGTLPSILQKLLSTRKAKRKEAEKESNPFRKSLLDAEQLAYKLTANSLYGQLGSPTFKIRMQNLAASTTAYGRKQISFAKKAIEVFYGPAATIVYGDTDSLFVNFNPRDASGKRLEGREALVETIRLTEECGKFISQTLKPPHDFEYDKVFWPFIIFSKKRYVGNKYEDSPDDFKQTSMGIVLKRRDNAPILKTIYGGAIKILLNQKNTAAAAAFVKNKCNELLTGTLSLGQLTITKSLRGGYKDPTRIAHKVLADRITKRDPGNAPASGDRIGYVYIMTENEVELQGDRIETPAYIKQKGLRPDIPYYIEHQLSKPLMQLFSLRVHEMPGFCAPAAGWPEDEGKASAMKEKMVYELLFRDVLQKYNAIKMRAGAAKMGFTVLPKEQAALPTLLEEKVKVKGKEKEKEKEKEKAKAENTVEIAPIIIEKAAGPKKQMVLDSWFADSILVSSSRPKKPAAKKQENGTSSDKKSNKK